jgi:hypothetical protein
MKSIATIAVTHIKRPSSYNAYNVEDRASFGFMAIHFVVQGAKKPAHSNTFVFDHAGLLVNEPPGQCRIALHLVVRRLLHAYLSKPISDAYRFGFFRAW